VRLQELKTTLVVTASIPRPEDTLGNPVPECQIILDFLQQELTELFRRAKLQSNYHYQQTNTQSLPRHKRDTSRCLISVRLSLVHFIESA